MMTSSRNPAQFSRVRDPARGGKVLEEGIYAAACTRPGHAPNKTVPASTTGLSSPKMVTSLKKAEAISNVAHLLYDFLPGSGRPEWKSHVSFRSIAQRLGLGHYWQEGSKEPAISHLLRLTLDREPLSFEKLILEVVGAGIPYCRKNGKPIRSTHIKTLNGYLLELGFKFPALWDKEFWSSLDGDSSKRAQHIVEAELRSEELEAASVVAQERKREELRDVFYALSTDDNRQRAGLKLERVLNELFEMFQLAPRGSFKLVGEQIDGSFLLDEESYLVEAKWEAGRLAEDKLLVFRGKIEGKSSFTRGAFVSVSGFTNECLESISKHKQPTFFLIDGYDLTTVLEGQITLIDLLRAKRNCLAEEGTLLYRASKK
ncbi:MAG: restriction endonuclease [Acidobacteriia bacterium]|nr:restriction endonuclease [Terriglobia bacterium]